MAGSCTAQGAQPGAQWQPGAVGCEEGASEGGDACVYIYTHMHIHTHIYNYVKLYIHI